MALSIVAPAAAAPRVVRVGVYENEPKVFTEADGDPSGIFVDLLRGVAEEEGWELVFVPGTWEQGLAALQEGRIDLMPDVAYSVERDKTQDFHETPVVESWSYVYAPANLRVEVISDLQGRRVAVLGGSIQETVFSQMVRGFGYDVEVVPVPSLEEAFQKASNGEVDAAIANYLFGDDSYREYGLSKTPIVFNAVPLYYATAEGKNADLLEAIDRHLETWISQPDSVYYRTLSAYTAKDRPGGIPSWVFWTVGVIGALLLASGGLILLLRWQVGTRTRSLVEANKALAGAHEAVKEAEERLRLALEASNEGIWDWSPKTGEITWSARSYEMLGYERDEFPATFEEWEGLVHPDDRRMLDEELGQRLRTGGRDFSVEYRLRTKAGAWLWVISRGRVVELDDDGEIERVMGTHADVTARKRAEADLAESEARYRSIVETSPDGICFLDCEGAVRMSNQKAAEMCGCDDPRKLIGRRFAELLAPEDRDAFEKQNISDPEQGQPLHSRATMQRPNASAIPVELSAATITDADGHPAAIAVTVRDLSAR